MTKLLQSNKDLGTKLSTEYLNNRVFEKLIINFQQTKKEKIKYQIFYDDISKQKINNRKNKLFEIPEGQPEKSIKEHFVAQEELAHAFLLLSQNIVKYAKFSHIGEDDGIQEGVLICFERAEKFDSQKGKAFNYLTTCILNHFKQLYRSARNYQELKRKINEIYNRKLDQLMPYKKRESSSNKFYTNEY